MIGNPLIINGYTHIFPCMTATISFVFNVNRWRSHWNQRHISYHRKVIITYNYFRFGAAILISGCRSMSDNVANDTIGLAITENVGVAVGISEISHTIEKL